MAEGQSSADRHDDTLMTAWRNSLSTSQNATLDAISNGYLGTNAQGQWYNPRAANDAGSGYDQFMNQAIPIATLAGVDVAFGGALTPMLGPVGAGAATGAFGGAATALGSGGNVGKGALTGAVGGGLANSGIANALGGGVPGAVGAGAVGGAVGAGLRGGNVGQGAATGALGGGFNAAGNQFGGPLGGIVGSNLAGIVGNGLFGAPGYSGGGPSPPSAGGSPSGNNMANNPNGNNMVMGGTDPSGALSGAGGINWQQLLGGLGGLFGNFANGNSQQTVSNNQAGAMTTAQNSGNISPFNFAGVGGASAFGGPGGLGTSLSPGFNGAFGGFGDLAGQATGMAGQTLQGGLPSNVQGAMSNYGNWMGQTPQSTNPMLQGVFGGNQFAQGGAANLMGAGFNQLNNPLIGQANNAAGGLMNSAGANYNLAYNSSLQGQLAALQPGMQQQMNSLQSQQFGRGQLGTSGGALQTQAMATGFGNAMLNAQNNAVGQANNTMGMTGNLAGLFSGIGANQMGLGNSLLSNALGQFNNTSNIGSNISNSIFGQNQAIQNMGYNQALGNIGAQQGASMFPTSLAGMQLGLGTNAAQGGNVLNTMGNQNFGMGMNYANLANNAMQGSARNQILGSMNPNFMPGNTGYGNMLSSLFGPSGMGQAGGGNLGNIFSGISSMFGNGGTGNVMPPQATDPSGTLPMGGYDPTLGAGTDINTQNPDLNYNNFDLSNFNIAGGQG